jgi:hypothetical protein
LFPEGKGYETDLPSLFFRFEGKQFFEAKLAHPIWDAASIRITEHLQHFLWFLTTLVPWPGIKMFKRQLTREEKLSGGFSFTEDLLKDVDDIVNDSWPPLFYD